MPAARDSADPDWFLDPVSGRRSPDRRFAFGINHRDEADTGNVKQVWEMSRHHHLTVLATAWWLTRDDRYAEAVADQLRSWWRANPFLTGVHWTSGIEAGVRLLAWVWIRRLLDDWPKIGDLFEDDPDAQRQIAWHQEYLAAFPSHGSSANNHVIAEAAGLLAAASAFPWYAASPRWRRERRRPPRAGARREHLQQRDQPRAGERLPPFRAGARARRGRRGRNAGHSARPRDVAADRPDAGRGGGASRRRGQRPPSG